MRISDWSSYVCSSDLLMNQRILPHETLAASASPRRADAGLSALAALASFGAVLAAASCCVLPLALAALVVGAGLSSRSEERRVGKECASTGRSRGSP